LRKLIAYFAAALIIWAAFAPCALAQLYEGLKPGIVIVTDETTTLNTRDIDSIRTLANQISIERNIDVLVIVKNRLTGSSLDEFARSIAVSNSLGGANGDRWIVVAVFVGDRDMRVQFGRGLKGALTNFKSKYIVENVFIPHFKQGDYATGIHAGLTALGKASGRDYPISAFNSAWFFLNEYLFGQYLWITILCALVLYAAISNYFQSRYQNERYAPIEGYYDSTGYHDYSTYHAPYGTTWDYDERSGCLGGDDGSWLSGGDGGGGFGGGGGGGGASGSW
jgi:uncharacterized protein